MSWFIFSALAVGLMYLMKFTPPKIDFILVRVSALLWLSAGLAGLDGVIGRMVTSGVAGIMDAINSVTGQAVGTAAGWLVALFVSVAWIGAMLPDKTVGMKRSTVLVVSGVVLPTLLSSIPGSAGEMLRAVILPLGGIMNSIVTGWLT